MTGVGIGRLLRGAAAVVPLVVGRPGVGVALVQAGVVRIEAVVDILQVQFQRGPQHLLQLGIAGPTPGMDELVEELALHVVVPGVMDIDAALAEKPRVERLATEAGLRVGLGQRLVGFGDLPGQAGAGLGLDAVVPAVDRAAEHRPPAQQRHAPAHAGVGEDSVAEDAVGHGVGGGHHGVQSRIGRIDHDPSSDLLGPSHARGEQFGRRRNAAGVACPVGPEVLHRPVDLPLTVQVHDGARQRLAFLLPDSGGEGRPELQRIRPCIGIGDDDLRGDATLPHGGAPRFALICLHDEPPALHGYAVVAAIVGRKSQCQSLLPPGSRHVPDRPACPLSAGRRRRKPRSGGRRPGRFRSSAVRPCPGLRPGHRIERQDSLRRMRRP